MPQVRAVLFGVFEMQHELPPDTEYLFDPPHEVLAGHVYNGSRVFVCSSVQEGFGLCSVEAMACGAALVTSATRGPDDFAVHEQTALVSAPNDVAAMADNVEMLLRDETNRVELATRGVARAARFDWDESARILEAYLYDYGHDPSRFRS